ncbi:MAG: AMP-binding protein, partial [Hyphomicrobiales bacterium]
MMANPLYDTLFGQHYGRATNFLQLQDGQTITHAAFLGIAAQYANLLAQLGLEPGDRVAVQIQKSPQALAVYAACVQAGIVFLPLNTAYTADEVTYFVENSGARILLCDQHMADALKPVADVCNAVLETLNDDGSGTFHAKARALPETFATVARTEDDLAAFLYT